MKKIITLVLLFMMSATVFAETISLTATDRVKNLAGEETSWRFITGGAKIIGGGLVSGLGLSMLNHQESLFTSMVLVPLGVTLMIPGLVTFGWGVFDVFCGSRDYANEYDKLKLSSDSERDAQAAQYLKEKAEKDYRNRKPSWFNGFGLFSMNETPAEREYKAYTKAQSGAK